MCAHSGEVETRWRSPVLEKPPNQCDACLGDIEGMAQEGKRQSVLMFQDCASIGGGGVRLEGDAQPSPPRYPALSIRGLGHRPEARTCELPALLVPGESMQAQSNRWPRVSTWLEGPAPRPVQCVLFGFDPLWPGLRDQIDGRPLGLPSPLYAESAADVADPVVGLTGGDLL